MRLALDIDGTITTDPPFFSLIAKKVMQSGGDVHVVSSRSPEGRSETLEELKDYGIVFSALHLLPHISTAQSLCPHSGLNWFERHLWLKVDYALANEITHFVDDDPKVLALFARFAPAVVAIATQDRSRLVELRSWDAAS